MPEDLAAEGWEPVLDEEFDGGSLDESIWRPMNMGGTYHGEGLSVDDTYPGEDASGFLTMTAFSREDLSGTLRHYGPRITTGSSGEGWATAEAGFLPAYGYVEARIKMDRETGTKTAFWLMPRSGHGSPFRDPGDSGPEFTIVEWSDYRLQGGMHWDELVWQGGENHIREHYEEVGDYPGDATRDDSFHVWSALWTPDGYRMFLDGEEYLRSDYGVTYNPEQLILSMHASSPPSGGYGDVDESTNQMVVDYVRWWQRPVESIPDQFTSVNEPLSVPFSVTDYFYSSSTHPNPGSVRVTATSSDQTVVADSGLSVAGNGPAEPEGSFSNADFEDLNDDLGDDTQGWYAAGGDPSIWDGDAHTGDHSLRLEGRDDSGGGGDPPPAGGRVTQAISDLEPGTSYILGTRYNQEVDWDDLNGNGYVDCGDEDEIGPCPSGAPGLEPIHASGGRFEWGIQDVDADRGGDQTVSSVRQRNAWQERPRTRGGRVNQDEFREDYLVFTTGPDTTEVTAYLDNATYAGTDDASNVSIDSLYLRPMVPPHRTLTVQPEDGAVGETTVTLTAVDENDQVLGTQEVHISVDDNGGLTNGSFEAYPQGHGWDLPELSEVVVDDPFSPDQVLELAYEEPVESPDHDPVTRQLVSGLESGSTYTLEFMAKGSLIYNVAYDETNACSGFGCIASTEDWETQSVTFTAGASGSGTIEIMDPFDDATTALVDDVRLIPDTSAPPDMSAPSLLDLEEQRAVDGAPHTILVDQAGLDIESVTSSNPDVVPSRSVALAGEGRYRTISFTPLRYRTGPTTLTFTYSEGGSTGTFDLPVVVSDERLVNPGFEGGAYRWDLPQGATLVGDDQARTGTGALEVGDTGGTPVRQVVTGLQYNTPFQLSGYVDGEVNVTVDTNQQENTDNPDAVTATWSGSGWNEGNLIFRPGQCAGCSMVPGGHNYDEEPGRVEILIEDADPGDGPSLVDDLSISYAPNMPTMPEVSLPESQTEVHWRYRDRFAIGHVPWDARWRDDVASISSSDEAVVPTENIVVNPDHPSTRLQDRAARPFEWSMVPVANGVTGRSDVTLTLTDPTTGASASETWPVTVNAGTFNNGDFERRMEGWENTFDGYRRDDIRFRRPWGHIGADYDRVLRMWLGGRAYQVENLEAGEEYVLQGNAFGAGSEVIVRANNGANAGNGDVLGGPVSVDNPDEWAATDELRFTPLADDSTTPGRDESDVWILLVDSDYDPGTSVVGEDPSCRETESDAACRDAELWDYYDYYPCTRPRVGMTCFDDIGLFRAADID